MTDHSHCSLPPAARDGPPAARDGAAEVVLTAAAAAVPAAIPPDMSAGSRVARELVGRVAEGLRVRSSAWTAAPQDGVSRFCDAVVADSPLEGEEHFKTLRARGVSLDALYSGYLAGAAVELGRRWEEDEIGFAEVTLGMSRLHRMLRDLQPDFVGPVRNRPAARAFVAAAPGETHVFGPMMIADQLRRLGWQVQTDVSGNPAAALAEAVKSGALDVVGISASSEAVAPALTRLISDLRRRMADRPASIVNPIIVIGGALARNDPAALRDAGADVIARGAADLARALEKAQERVEAST